MFDHGADRVGPRIRIVAAIVQCGGMSGVDGRTRHGVADRAFGLFGLHIAQGWSCGRGVAADRRLIEVKRTRRRLG